MSKPITMAITMAAALFAASGCCASLYTFSRLEDRTTAPSLPSSALELVANVDHPPGNIAVSKTGRVFFTFHPDGGPPIQLAELVNGKPVAYPNAELQDKNSSGLHLRSALAVRVDSKDRLWVLDFADFGRGQPRILAFDLATNRLVHRYDFPSEVAGLFSMLNDFQVDPKAEKIYIADASPLFHTPAIVVYDIEKKTSRRVLEWHPSLSPENYVIQAPGRDMLIAVIVTLQIGIDSIALDKRGEWLYYGPLSGERMYRVPTRYLNDEALAPVALDELVEDFGPKTLSDGITIDVADNIYLSDMEHSAILTLGPDRRLRTLLKDERLRWPDGFSFGPDGWLYVTCSSLHHVLFVSDAHIKEHAPYQIYRFRPSHAGVAGH